MLSDLLNAIVRLARAADHAELVPIPGDPRHLLLRQGSSTELMEVPPPLRGAHLEGVEDIVQMVHNQTSTALAELYHDQTALVLVLDQDDRREQVTVSLKTTHAWEELRGLARDFDVPSVVRFLRHDLAGMVSDLQPIIDALSNLDFERSVRAGAKVSPGSESLGRQVEARVQQADKVPQHFLARVPVYTNPGLAGIYATVRVGIYLEPGRQVVHLATLPDDPDVAMRQVQLEVHDLLLGKMPDLPVYQGRP